MTLARHLQVTLVCDSLSVLKVSLANVCFSGLQVSLVSDTCKTLTSDTCKPLKQTLASDTFKTLKESQTSVTCKCLASVTYKCRLGRKHMLVSCIFLQVSIVCTALQQVSLLSGCLVCDKCHLQAPVQVL